jgi:hypothetical protein
MFLGIANSLAISFNEEGVPSKLEYALNIPLWDSPDNIIGLELLGKYVI